MLIVKKGLIPEENTSIFKTKHNAELINTE